MVKQVIFYCDTGFPYSVLAAAIRTGLLPIDRCPQKNELASLLRPYGMGKGNARIYSFKGNSGDKRCLALWTNRQGDMVIRAITSFLGLYKIADYTLVSLEYKRTPLMRAGIWLSRIPLLRGAGLGMVRRGVKDIYGGLVETACRRNPP